MATLTEVPRRRLHPIVEAGAILGISRTGVYELVKAGDLHLVKIGGRSLIAADELDALVGRLVERAGRSTAPARS